MVKGLEDHDVITYRTPNLFAIASIWVGSESGLESEHRSVIWRSPTPEEHVNESEEADRFGLCLGRQGWRFLGH